MPLSRTGYGGPVNVHTGRGAGMPRGGRPVAPSGPGGFPPVNAGNPRDPFAGLPTVGPPPRGGRTAGPPVKGGRGKAGSPAGPAPAAPPKPAPGVPPAKFINAAKAALGDPYTWGGATPRQGFDCSGLVQYALTQAGLKNVPRTSEAQYQWVQHIPRSALQPGDLIFEQWPGDQSAPGHVAIYLGNGRIEEAATAGTPVHVVPWSPGQVSAQGGQIVGYGRPPGLQNSAAANLGAGQAGAAAASGGGGGTLPIGGTVPQIPPAGGGGAGGGGGGRTGGGRARAGGGIQTTAATGTGPDAGAGAAVLGPLGVVLGGAGAVGTAGRALADVSLMIEWFLVPSNWVRVFCGVGGILSLSTGVFMMSHVGGSVEVPVVSAVAGNVPTPAGAMLPMGVLLVGAGGVLLFVAFHNLPSNAGSIGGLLSWLAAKTAGAATGVAVPAGGRGAGSSAAAPAPLPIGNIQPGLA